MKKKVFLGIITFALFFVSSKAFSVAVSSELTILFLNEENFSVSIKDTPIKDVLAKIEKDKGIWLKGDKANLSQKISISFTKMPIEKGLKRILGRINYGFEYNKNGQVIGIVVAGKSDRIREVTSSNDPIAPQDVQQPIHYEPGFEVVYNTPPPENPNAKPLDLNAQIVRNSPPPENPNAKPIDTTVVNNCPPPEKKNVKPIDTTVVKGLSPDDDKKDPFKF
ncbi:MAG: STN domain-containing protein [Desulfobacterales bacterium]|nr:STN domain-containing protein [Desulfobacterales bacterium]MBF0396877.1 STN domain-containing protein [Desulfobacterales bacterium]